MEQAENEVEGPVGLDLYMTSWCAFCARVLAVAERLGIQLVLHDIDTDAERREELARATGRTTVPCLRIDDTANGSTWMHESQDIIRFLETRGASSSV